MLRRGLTLIELIIVAGILVALTTLVVGVIRIGVEARWKAQCMKNLHQLYLATKLYEETFGGPPIGPIHLVSWKPEMRSILICPKDPNKGWGVGGLSPVVPRPGVVPCSYSLIYYGSFWILKGRIKLIMSPEEAEELKKIALHELVSEDGHYFVCLFHELAVLRDGQVTKAKRWTLSTMPRRPLQLPKEP